MAQEACKRLIKKKQRERKIKKNDEYSKPNNFMANAAAILLININRYLYLHIKAVVIIVKVVFNIAVFWGQNRTPSTMTFLLF